MDPITVALQQELERRAAVGTAKYGVTVAERSDLSLAAWAQHLIEELLDAAVYAKKLTAFPAPPAEPTDAEVEAIRKRLATATTDETVWLVMTYRTDVTALLAKLDATRRENERLKESLDSADVEHSDEIAAHQETILLWRNAEAKRDQLLAALQEIRDNQGKVCDRYEECEHVACASSYTAWAIAHKALKEMR